MAYQFKMLKKESTPIFSSGGYGFFRLSSETLPTPTTSLVYTLSSDSSYYIVGTDFFSINAIENDTSGGTAGSGLDSTWSGGELVIPNTYNGKPVKAIAPKAFSAIRNITSLYIYDGITTIGHRCFQCVSPNYDTAMTSCRLPNTLESLGGESGRVFWGRQGLTSIDIPTSIASLGESSFYFCTTLASISMPNVTSIGGSVFYACTKLTSLTIPSTCTSIGNNALHCASSIQKCTFTFEGTTPPTIYTNTFATASINKIIVPVGCGETYKTATNWTTFASYIEEATA